MARSHLLTSPAPLLPWLPEQGFDTVLIDEAAQAVEMSTLIPLK